MKSKNAMNEQATQQEIETYLAALDNYKTEYEAWYSRFDPESTENPQSPRPPRPPMFQGWLGE